MRSSQRHCPLAARAASADTPPHACYSGAYRLGGGYIVIIRRATKARCAIACLTVAAAVSIPTTIAHFHGGPGWASREPRIADAVFDGCPGQTLQFHLKDGPSGVARARSSPRTPTTFSSIGNTLYGELFAPAKPQALVVLVFGSGQDSAVAFNYLQHLLPTTASQCSSTTSAAPVDRTAASLSTSASSPTTRLLPSRTHASCLNAPGVPVGLMGESQGGWIAPLAAARAPADFVVVSYGLAISPLEEDREEVLSELRAKRYDDSVVAKGRELTDITGRIMLSRFTDGLDDLRKFKAAHADAKWLQEVEGDFTGPLLRSPDDQFEELRAALGFDAILDYDAQAALRRVRTPMLWIVAGKDTEAPPAPTLEFLRTSAVGAPQLDIAVFPNADHGILEEGDRAESLCEAVERLSRPAGEAGSSRASWTASSARRSCSRIVDEPGADSGLPLVLSTRLSSGRIVTCRETGAAHATCRLSECRCGSRPQSWPPMPPQANAAQPDSHA